MASARVFFAGWWGLLLVLVCCVSVCHCAYKEVDGVVPWRKSRFASRLWKRQTREAVPAPAAHAQPASPARVRRAVSKLVVDRTTRENRTANEIIFTLSSEFLNSTREYAMANPDSPFRVDQGGNVRLKPGREAELDYDKDDFDDKIMLVFVNATNRNNREDVVEVEVRLQVTDINDENPEFTNRPIPYLATVAATAPAGTLVFPLVAQDQDTGSNLNYTLQSGGENRFELDIRPEFDAELRRSIKVAFIRTKGSGRFEDDKTYRLLVSARDYGATDTIQEALATVEVLVGIRPPQFYNATYHGLVRENSGIGQTLSNQLRVSAKSFQNKTVTYTLLDQYNQTSTQFQVEADGTIKTRESFDFEGVPRAQRPPVKILHVIAKERDTNLESMARLEVEVVDDNDNSPMFDLSTYRTSVPEDVALGTDIMSVIATDDDFGANAELVYSVNNANFTIETMEENGRYVGHIKINAPLDYDRLLSHMHSFTVTAQDKGSPPRSGTAEVRVSLENVNDEPPEFRLSSFVFNLREDSPVKSVVTVVQAIDLDGDNINYYFTPNRNRDGIFSISQDSGLIRVEEDIPSNVDMYTLNITAQDDGTCCPGNRRLKNETFIVLEIMDINLHKPRFPNCTTYNSATVPEKSPPGTPIIQVKAIDQDRGINGDISYEIVISERQTDSHFRIDASSGQLSTDQMFDRETTKFLSVTMKARDHGNPQLEGYCTFQVKISDVNDNPPRFDQNTYKAAISENIRPGGSVLSIRAYDADEGNNAQVSYVLTESQGGLFAIERNSGIISLNKSLTGKKSYSLTVVAMDGGTPSLNSTVGVVVEVADLTSKPPRWLGNYDALAYKVNETVPRGFIIATFEANSGITSNRIVDFGLIDERGFPSAQFEEFLIRKEGTRVHLVVAASLDILKKKKVYDLRLRVTNRAPMPLYAEIHPQIMVLDTNNQVPQFVVETDGTIPGSAQENMRERQIVAEVTAFDRDEDPPNNELTFQLGRDPEENYLLFDIEQKDSTSAVVTTSHMFDRETKAQYYLTIIVQDSAPSTLYSDGSNKPNEQQGTLKVEIADQNDNAPYFNQTQYRTRIREDAGINSRVLQVFAIDKDETAQLSYQITSGNTRNAFVIQDRTGDIFVGRQLDYETEQHEYNLTVTVSDSVFSNTTQVLISVLDVNDNPPQFNDSDYIVTDVVEEVQYSRSNKKWLLNVSATDGDRDRNTQMRYSLLGYATMGEHALFEIDAQTGSLYLIGKLDRDAPNGFTDYQFNVQAEDERENPLTGIANINIRPKDVNDNWPAFNQLILEGHLFEHSPVRSPVMTVVATDNDFGENGTVVYSIIQAPAAKDQRMFRIREETGEIYTNVGAEEFDREVTAKYELTVEARDLGPKSSAWPNLNPRNVATVRIILDDINDKWPVFYQKIYHFTMSEAQVSGEVAKVKAMDEDIDYNAKLEYSLSGSNDLQHFSINTINNEGIINVFRPVDFEAGQTFFNLTVKVQDPNVTHTAYAYVEITVQDFNDNAPKFSRSSKVVRKKEDVAIGTFLARFDATDADTGINKEFEYSIDRSTDRLRQFEIDGTGNVRVRRKLDRETQEVHYLRILAIDKGDPPQNGSATLVVHVDDVNDNFPHFQRDYEPHVQEHDKDIGKLVLEVFGEDPDTMQFGPPFGFASPDCAQCPCEENPTCDKFSLEFKPNRAGGNGSALIRTLQEFDREKNKYFMVPIVMWDMRGKGSSEARTGTNMLKVIIADINDNDHKPGHQDILVYNYKGQFGPIVIGYVYAEDPDDWDIPDKRFFFTGADYIRAYFSVNVTNGAITMRKGVPGDTDYTFTVRVHDVVRDREVESTVTIHIKDLPEEAVLNSGAVRLTGMTAEAFVKRKKNGTKTTDYGDSCYVKFRRLLATKLGVPLENVDIVSIMEGDGYTDVRYAAHGSPWYTAAKTDGVIAYNRAEFEQVAGVTIGQVPLDECIKERFEGGCYNRLIISGKPVVINTNGTSYVGVGTAVLATQGCRADRFPDPIECTPNYCYNGGVCKKDLWGVLKCECPYGFRGPRCQGTHHSFSGSQFLLLPALEQCESGATSLEFITKSADGILLYNGPVAHLPQDAAQDFLLLELRGGFPRLRIDHGTGELDLSLDGTDGHGNQRMHALNDGKWHRIDIVRHGKEVELTVDQCRDATIEQELIKDDKPCRSRGMTPGENVFLNVHSLLQLGGLYTEGSNPPTYPRSLPTQGFNGCVKNLIHNGKMYNLHVAGKPDYPSGENNCPREDAICGVSSMTGPKCGQHGQCVATWQPNDFTCICDPGWRDSSSERCGKGTTTKDLKANSYLRWRLKDTFFSALGPREINFQARFRTRDPDGVILTMSTPDNTRSITLELLGGHLTVSYNLGDGSQSLTLREISASDGQWHTVFVTRVGQAFTLRLDGGEGRNFASTQGRPTGHAEINIQNFIYAGASVSESKNQPVIASDLNETCIEDIRMENRWFPLTTQENGESPAAVLLDYPHIEDDCVRRDCKPGVCSTGNEVCFPDCKCIPLWGLHECGCPSGFIPGGLLAQSGCIEVDYCASQPCGNNGTCENVRNDPNRKFRCICPPGWTGSICMNVGAYVVEAGLTTGAIVAIIVCIFILLVLALVVILLVRFGSKAKDDKYILEVDPEDDIRENVMNYDEEGAGEEDQDGYDISRLRKPEDGESLSKTPMMDMMPQRMRPLRAPGDYPDVGSFINDRLNDADDDHGAPPYDSVLEFGYEGEGSDAGSLSSLNTSSNGNDHEYDYLNDWGPKFSKLADMYGGGEEED